jgi:hypothetical protein
VSHGRELIGVVMRRAGVDNIWDISGNNTPSGKDGTNSLLKEYFIEEIYGEGAYEITTKDTFDTPSDDVVKKATEALKDLTEEQIAKVLHALKTK